MNEIDADGADSLPSGFLFSWSRLKLKTCHIPSSRSRLELAKHFRLM
jgi:hypothetical protein